MWGLAKTKEKKRKDTSYLDLGGRNPPQASLCSLEQRWLITEVDLRMKIRAHLGITPSELFLNSQELPLHIISPLSILLDMRVDGVV